VPAKNTYTQFGAVKSLLLVALGVLVCFASVSVFVLALPHISTWLRPSFLPPRPGAFVFFFLAAFSEELGKALGVVVAGLKRNHLSWFWLCIAIGGTFAIIERIGLRWTLTPENLAEAQAQGFDFYLADIRAFIGHSALTCVTLVFARILRHAPIGWTIGLLASSLMHFLTNILPMIRTNEFHLALPRFDFYMFFAIHLLILLAAFAFRHRLDWRT
jgi:RsiW-degrading membrane proteinase PrsW (M82 family)